VPGARGSAEYKGFKVAWVKIVVPKCQVPKCQALEEERIIRIQSDLDEKRRGFEKNFHDSNKRYPER
jgi:hypothetical protein